MQNRCKQTPTVGTNTNLGKSVNGSSTDDVLQQVFLQPSTVLAQESPELNEVSRYLKILLIVSFKYIYNVPFDICKVSLHNSFWQVTQVSFMNLAMIPSPFVLNNSRYIYVEIYRTGGNSIGIYQRNYNTPGETSGGASREIFEVSRGSQ